MAYMSNADRGAVSALIASGTPHALSAVDVMIARADRRRRVAYLVRRVFDLRPENRRRARVADLRRRVTLARYRVPTRPRSSSGAVRRVAVDPQWRTRPTRPGGGGA
jgi:hypothetical protein